MKIRIFMGDEEITHDDIKNFICVCPYVAELVNEVYYRNKKAADS